VPDSRSVGNVYKDTVDAVLAVILSEAKELIALPTE
jgi:hypothetical protein